RSGAPRGSRVVERSKITVVAQPSRAARGRWAGLTACATVQPKSAMSALYSDLQRAISGEVRFDAGSRALYATDGSNYRQVPIGVVIPRDAEDVIETVATCRQFGAPI